MLRPKSGGGHARVLEWRDRRAGTTMRRVLWRGLLSARAAPLLAAPPGARTIVVKLSFVPGKLAVKAPPASVAGTVQVPVTIADGRGNGAGWTLKVGSSVPVRVVAVTARCAANSTCTLPAAASARSGNVVLRAA